MQEENYIQQLANYIKKNLVKGYTIDSLKIALEKQEYSRISIEKAIKLANEQLAASAPIMKEKPLIKYEIVGEEVEKETEKKGFWQKIKE